MRRPRSFVCATVLAAASAFGVQPAFAAAPANDTLEGATAVSLGFSEVIDTTEATRGDDDAQLNEDCGAPATAASVWYTITLPAGSGVVVIDASKSDYTTEVLVGVGSPGALETVACDSSAVAFLAEAGTTYYVLAVDSQNDGGGNGGSLRISFNKAPPRPTLDVNVAPRGTFDSRTGAVTIRGTYSCSDAGGIHIFGDVAQSRGRINTIGPFVDLFEEGTCNGSSHAWSATAVPETGKFKGGRAVAIVGSFACGRFQCTERSTEQTVRLSGPRD